MNWIVWDNRHGDRTEAAHVGGFYMGRTRCGRKTTPLTMPAPRSTPRCKRCVDILKRAK